MSNDKFDEFMTKVERIANTLELFLSRCDEKTLELWRQCGREVSK